MSKKQSHDAKRNGTERAAILLLSLGEQEAAEVMKHMGAKDVQRIGAAMTQLQNISRKEVSAGAERVHMTVEGQTSLGVGVDEYLRKVLIGALGEDKAARRHRPHPVRPLQQGPGSAEVDGPARGRGTDPPGASADHCDRAGLPRCGPVGRSARRSSRNGCAPTSYMRIATLDGIQPTALHELDEVIEKQFAGKTGALKTSVIGGIKTAANILNFMDSSQESERDRRDPKVDEALGGKIQDLMFVFDDISEIDDRGMQEVLRAVPGEKLLLAMKGADEPLKEKIFKNMSQRAAEMLKDDLEAKGPVRLSEVEAAQKEILAIVRKMSEAGTIQLGGKGEEFV